MAERRMFAKTIIDSDAFLDMPMSAQALYFHLSMRADDEGFVNNPKKIQRMVGASDDNARLLIAKRFIIAFESGVVVIKHWYIHNYIRNDRFKDTLYQEEKSMLKLDEKKAYTEADKDGGMSLGIPNGYQMDTQDSIGKDSIGKDRIDKKFVRPSFDEVKQFCKENNLNVDAQQFVDFYESNGWKVGRNSMKDWKAACRNWARRNDTESEEQRKKQGKLKSKPNFDVEEMQRRAKLNDNYDI